MTVPGNLISPARRKIIVGLCSPFLWASIALAADAGQPAPPSKDEIPALIQQLGADDFNVRESAAARLQEAGPAAKSLLEQAAKSDSPEERLRAADILRRMDSPTLPGFAPDAVGVDQPERVTVGADGRSVTVTSGGRIVQINQDDAGIHLTVTGFIDGKPATQHYDATDPDALKKRSADAFALWQQWPVVDGQVLVRGPNGGNIIVGAGGTFEIDAGIPQLTPDDADDFSKLTTTEIAMMRAKHFTDAQTGKVLEEIQRVRIAKADVENAGIEPGSRQAAFLQASDNLRQQLADAGLIDPGTLLPPPASSRLGVSVGGDPLNQAGGVVVNTIEPDSRAQHLGLAPGDLIQQMNGKPVKTTSELRQSVMDNRTLTISIIRGGQELTLRETPPKTQPSPDK